MREDSVISRFFRMIEVFVFYHPKTFLSVILLATVFFASRIPYLEMYSNFADLLPQEHPYIELHNDVKDTFGGARSDSCDRFIYAAEFVYDGQQGTGKQGGSG